MPIYIYKAVDSKGKTVKGELEAASELDVSTQLAKIGLLPISIGFKEEKGFTFWERLVKKRARKVSSQHLIVFTRQFATIVRAAVPIVEGLGVLAEQSEDANLRAALNQIIHDIEEGKKLSEAMSKHPRVFSELYVNTVIAGEAGGVLDKVLLRLADVLEEERETLASLATAFRYPIMVVIALIIAVVIFSVRVVPAFAKIYAGFKAQLPLPTQMMILMSNALQGPWRSSQSTFLKISWYFILLGMVGGIFFIFKLFISTPKGRLWWDGLKFKMIIIGGVYNKMVMLRFASMLNVLYQAGLPILRILDIVKITIGNMVLAQEIDRIKRDVADGKGVSGGVLGSRLFPRLVGYMISVGEKSGSLSIMLDSLCDYFNLEVRTTVRTLTSLIEPIMTLILAVVVAFMALSVFLPMWNLLQVFRQGV